ncbi:hypothetical protein COK38_18995 [Bacillus cereus]|uniref:Uncharacterized protein n=1 Tax=Bacillus cereus TaxID=1396 RepID=A0AA44TDG9_BACCE|nr:hypothetical protein COK38_18995 [Bacillus cereus]
MLKSKSPPNTKFLSSLFSETGSLLDADARESVKSSKRLLDLSLSIIVARFQSELIAAAAIESVKSSKRFFDFLLSIIPAKF